MNELKRFYYRVGAKRRMVIWRIKLLCGRATDWIQAHSPELCGRCGRWVLHKDTRNVQHTSGAWVSVCDGCYQELYGDE